MYLRAVGRRFTQINAYFLVMNSERCNMRTGGMPISQGFWEWGCPKRGDARITVKNSGASFSAGKSAPS